MKEKVRAHSADDMLAAFLITYVTAAFRFEKYMPAGYMSFFNTVIFIVFAAVWLWLCFRNGQRIKIAFSVFTVLFWLVPLLVIFLYNNGPELFRFSIIMYVLSEFFSFLIYTPAEIIGKLFDISAAPALALMLISCAAAYFSGMFTGLEKR